MKLIFWYTVESLADVRRFVQQKLPDAHPGYKELADKWQQKLASGDEDLDSYLEIGRRMFWR